MSDFQTIADRVEIEALRGEFTATPRPAARTGRSSGVPATVARG
ncbi:hypothetical protein [Micromonospora sp. NPDC047740]